MSRDLEARLEDAVAAAADGATPEAIAEECDLDIATARKVVSIEDERRRRREARRGSL